MYVNVHSCACRPQGSSSCCWRHYQGSDCSRHRCQGRHPHGQTCRSFLRSVSAYCNTCTCTLYFDPSALERCDNISAPGCKRASNFAVRYFVSLPYICLHINIGTHTCIALTDFRCPRAILMSLLV